MSKKLKEKDLRKGMLVELNKKDWSDFVDTESIGVVLSWDKVKVKVYRNHKKESFWVWNLREVKNS